MTKKQYKLTLLGEGGVGKTSLKNRYLTGEFSGKYHATLGVDFSTHKLTISGMKLELSLWDVAGQTQFKSIRQSYFQGSSGGLVVYDVTRPESFDAIDENWVKAFWTALPDQPPIVVIANKTDLAEERKVSREDGERYAEKLRQEFGATVLYFETSAKEGTNVTKAFETLAEVVLEKDIAQS